MRKKILIIGIIILLLAIELSGCMNTQEPEEYDPNKDIALGVGIAYLKDKYGVLYVDYGNVVSEQCMDRGSYYSIVVHYYRQDLWYGETEHWFSCKVDKRTLEILEE